MPSKSRKSNKRSNKNSKDFIIKEVVVYKGGNYQSSEKKRKSNLKKVVGRDTPSHEIVKGDGYPYFRFTFKNQDEKLLASQGTFFMKTEGITFRSRMSSGFKKALARNMAGENFFLNEYYLKDIVKTREEYVQLTIDNPGQTLVKKIMPGESFYVTPRNFLACSRNLKVSAKFQLSRIAAKNGGLLMTSFINETEQPGYVFVQSYGSLEEKKIKKGDEIQVDNSHVLCYDKHCKVKLSMISNFRGKIWGGEGITYKISVKNNSDDATIYIQTHSFQKFARNVCKSCPLMVSPGRSSVSNGNSSTYSEEYEIDF